MLRLSMSEIALADDDKPQKEYIEFLWLPNFVFTCIGYNVIKISRSKRQRYVANSIFTLLLGIHLFDKYFMFKQFLMLIRMGDVMNVIRITSYVAYSIDANIKFVALNLNLRRAREINTLLEQAYPRSQQERRQYRVNAHYWQKTIITIIWIYFIATAAIALTPLLQSISQFAVDAAKTSMQNATFLYFKPIPMEYVYEYRTPYRYIFTYMLESCYILFTTITNVGTDLWLIHNVAQICMHLEFIQRTLQLYIPSKATYRRDCAYLAMLIRKHQIMFFLIAELNSMFGISLAFTLLSTTGLLCVMAVQLSIESLDTFFFVLLSFLGIVLIQFALVCNYGHKLMEASQNIALAAYEHRWYDCSQPYKKMVLIIMMRAQKRGQIVAKGLTPISMDSLSMVVIMTYRVFTLVQTLIK